MGIPGYYFNDYHAVLFVIDVTKIDTLFKLESQIQYIRK